MKRRNQLEAAVFVGLVAAGIAVRVLLRDLPTLHRSLLWPCSRATSSVIAA